MTPVRDKATADRYAPLDNFWLRKSLTLAPMFLQCAEWFNRGLIAMAAAPAPRHMPHKEVGEANPRGHKKLGITKVRNINFLSSILSLPSFSLHLKGQLFTRSHGVSGEALEWLKFQPHFFFSFPIWKIGRNFTIRMRETILMWPPVSK